MKKPQLFLICITLLQALSFNTFAQTTTTELSPTQDAYIAYKPDDPNWANVNGGAGTAFYAMRWTFSGVWGTYRNAIQFDLSSIPENAIIISANLFLGGINHNNGLLGRDNSGYLSRITTPWTETGITWNTLGSNYSTADQLTTPITSSSAQDITVDIKSFVEAWLSGTPNNGMVLRLQKETVDSYASLYFASKEHTTTTKRPKLTIEYATPPVGASFDNPIDVGALGESSQIFNYQHSENNCPANYFGDNFGDIDPVANRGSDDIFYKFSLTEDYTIKINTCASEIFEGYNHILDQTGNTIVSFTVLMSGECTMPGYNGFSKNLSSGTYYLVTESYSTGNCGVIDVDIKLVPRFKDSKPTSTVACVNNTATFDVNVSHAFDSYQWEFSSDAGSSWIPFGKSQTSVSIDHVNMAMDQYAFRCKGYFNGDEVISSEALLYVNDLPEVTSNLTYYNTKNETLILRPTKDNYVISLYPENYYGNYSRIRSLEWTAGPPYSSHSYLEIDLSNIPKNAVITNCKLKLFGVNHHESNPSPSIRANSFYVSRVAQPWTENEVNWNNQPGVYCSSCPYEIYHAGTENSAGHYQDDVEIDITNMISEWHAGLIPNYGLRLKLANSDYYRSIHFASSDYFEASEHPLVEIEYTIPSKTICTDNVQVQLSGANSYAWNPATGLSCSDCFNPLITLNNEMSYFVSATDNNSCLSIYNFNVTPCEAIYGEVGHDLDGGYYIAKYGCLFFKFTEDYAVDNGSLLEYRIYNETNEYSAGSLPNIIKHRGANFNVIDLGGILSTGMYILEVKNAKQEVFQLRFLYTN